MAFAIGFGSIEQDFERAEEEAISEYAARRYAELNLDYFTDEFVDDVSKWLNDRAKAYQDTSAVYKSSSDFPDRYSYYWSSVVADASHLVAILSVHHINRRHAMSPDGWALMQTEKLVHLKALVLDDLKRRDAA